MAKLQWDQTGERFYETGVSKGVLYPVTDGAYGKGVAWNGLTNVMNHQKALKLLHYMQIILNI